MAPSKSIYALRNAAPFVVLLLALASTAAVTAQFWTSAKAKDEARFTHHTTEMTERVAGEMDKYITLLRATASLLTAADRVQLHGFRDFIRRMEPGTRYPGIQGLGLTQVIEKDQVPLIEEEMRKQGYEDFEIWPKDERETYHAILFLEPLDNRNRAALGYDMFTEPVRREAMELARDTAAPAITQKVNLVQEIEGEKQAGFLIYMPLYDNGDPPPDLEARRLLHIGYAYSPFRAGKLFQSIFPELHNLPLTLKVYDGAAADAESMLFASANVEHQPARPLNARRTMKVLDRTWTLEYSPSPYFEYSSDKVYGNYALAAGLIITSFLFLFSLRLVRALNLEERSAQQLKDSQVALAESQERLRVALAASNTGTFRWDLLGGEIFWDANFQRLFGISQADAPTDYTQFLDRVHPQDRVRVDREIWKAVERGEDLEMELRTVWPDGSVHWLLERAAVFSNESDERAYVAGACTDITRLKHAEAELAESHRRLELVMGSVEVGVWYCDLPFDQLQWNETCKTHFGILPEEPVSIERFFERIHPEDREFTSRAIQDSIENHAYYDATYRTVGPDGEIRHIRALGRCFYDETGNPKSFDGITVDVTAVKRTEEQLKEFNDQLELRVMERTRVAEERAAQVRAMAVELTQAEHQERKRLASLLHDELQQLIAAAKIRLSSVGWEHIGDMVENVRQAEEMLAQAIQVTRSLSVELSPPVLRDRGLIAALEWVVRRVQQEYHLKVHLSAEIPEVQPTNESLGIFLLQAVRELLFNVFKHAGVQEAWLRVQAPEGKVQIIVEDHGKGFDTGALWGAQAPAEHFGIINVQQRVQLLGGTFIMESRPGEGTRVVLETPEQAFQPAEAPAPAPYLRQPALLSGDGDGAGPKIRVLLVDDHKIVREGIARLLRNESDLCVVGEASNGVMAVQLAQETQPDVIIMDINMPMMNGIEATRKIREQGMHARIVGLSMHERDDMAAAMMQAGASAFLSKDGPSADLLRTIREMVVVL